MQPLVFGKLFKKRANLSNEFRENVNLIQQNATEVCYLYQYDKSVSDDIEQIKQLHENFDSVIRELLSTFDFIEKFNIIHNSYKKYGKKLENIKLLLISKFYPLIANFPKELNEKYNKNSTFNGNKKSLFGNFNLDEKKRIDFEKIKIIKPPENYNKIIKEDDDINNYDKFVAVVNLIISLRDLINFEKEFIKKEIETLKEEKNLLQKEEKSAKEEKKKIEIKIEKIKDKLIELGDLKEKKEIKDNEEKNLNSAIDEEKNDEEKIIRGINMQGTKNNKLDKITVEPQSEQPAEPAPEQPAEQTEPAEQPPEQPAEQPPQNKSIDSTEQQSNPNGNEPNNPPADKSKSTSKLKSKHKHKYAKNKNPKNKWGFMIAAGILLVAAGIAMSFLTFGFGIIPLGVAGSALSVVIPSALGTALVTGASMQFAKSNKKEGKFAIAAIALGAALTLSAILLSVFTFGLGVGAVALAGTVVAGLAIGIPAALGASSIIAGSIAYDCLSKTPEGYTELSDPSKQNDKFNNKQSSPNSEIENNPAIID